jgi:2-isopropylmalate synthase
LKRLQGLGFTLPAKQLNSAFERFKELCDKKKQIFDEDLAAIVDQETLDVPEVYRLDYLNTNSGNRTIPTATVTLVHEGKKLQDSSIGDGPVDAAYRAVDRITGLPGRLTSYSVRGITSGKDALGEANIKVAFDDQEISAMAASTDVIESSVRAYLAAINKLLALRARLKGKRRTKKAKPKGL